MEWIISGIGVALLVACVVYVIRNHDNEGGEEYGKRMSDLPDYIYGAGTSDPTPHH